MYNETVALTNSLHSTFYILHSSRNGQAALSLIFLISGIVVVVGVTLAFLATSFVNSGLGFQTSERALAAASAGASDALLQLVRNKDFTSGGYSFNVGSGSVTVTAQGSGSNKTTIVSTATMGRYQRKIQVVASADSTIGQINIISWQEITF